MKNESRDEAIERVKPLLADRELGAYNNWCSSQLPALAPSLNAKLFQLFVNGKSCEEIRRLNLNLTLGQIVHARIEGDWDRRRTEHLEHLLTQTTARIQQVTVETADFVADLLAVANREHGDKLRRYLQSGDPNDLGDFKIDNIPQLKQAIEVLQKLTGQERQSAIHLSGSVETRPAQQQPGPPTSEQAGKVLQLLVGKK